MGRQSKCRDCGKIILFFYADDFMRQAPFELVERGFGDFGMETERRASRMVAPEDKDLILHDCKDRNAEAES